MSRYDLPNPSPDTHRYHYVDDHVYLYMRKENFLAESAATIFTHNQPNNDYNGYDYEDALAWFRWADEAGIVFG